MTEPDRNGMAARLWKLPGQLLLALLNATAVLVIVAAIAVLVVLARIDHFAENVAANMTEAVLSKVDLPAKETLANLRNLTAEARALRNAVAQFKSGENPVLQRELSQLKEKLAASGYQHRAAQRREIAPDRSSDRAIGPGGHRRADKAEKLFAQRRSGGASPHLQERDRRKSGGRRLAAQPIGRLAAQSAILHPRGLREATPFGRSRGAPSGAAARNPGMRAI